MNLRETKIQTLFLLMFLGGALGWAIGLTWSALSGFEFQISYLSAIFMLLLAATLLFWTLISRKRLRSGVEFSTQSSLVTARSAALAMATSRVSSLALGLYLALGIYNKVALNTPAGDSRFQISLLTCLGSLACVAVSVWLEKICKLPESFKR